MSDQKRLSEFQSSQLDPSKSEFNRSMFFGIGGNNIVPQIQEAYDGS